MTKTYCDRCGKEIERATRIRIPTKKTSGGFETEDREVCKGCEIDYARIISQLTDIRFVLFEGFMENGNRGETLQDEMKR